MLPAFHLDAFGLSYLSVALLGLAGLILLLRHSHKSPLTWITIGMTSFATIMAVLLFFERGYVGVVTLWVGKVGQLRHTTFSALLFSNLILAFRFPRQSPGFLKAEQWAMRTAIFVVSVQAAVTLLGTFSAEIGRNIWIGFGLIQIAVAIATITIGAKRIVRHGTPSTFAQLRQQLQQPPNDIVHANRDLMLVNVLVLILTISDLFSSAIFRVQTPLIVVGAVGIVAVALGFGSLYIRHYGETIQIVNIITTIGVTVIVVSVNIAGVVLNSRLASSYAMQQQSLSISQAAYIDYHMRALLWPLVGTTLFVVTGVPATLRRWLLRPLTMLTNAVKEIETGNLTVRIERMHDDEIGALTGAFNQMAASIDQSQRDLEILNNQLEQRVDARTQELAVAKESAENANQAKTAFLAQMSHELRTPLNIILGYAQMLRSKQVEPEWVHAIEHSGRHLALLIDDALDTAKIESDNIELKPTDIHLPTFFAELTAMARLPIETKGLTFTVDIAPTLPEHAMIDARRLRQILLNLLNNASKFTASGSVTLRVHPCTLPHQTRFEVTDTGIGIAEHELGKIFEPFRRLKSDDHLGGTGLGLSISAALVALLGGSLKVESRIGSGSRFYFEIPLPPVDSSQLIQLGNGSMPSADGMPIVQPMHLPTVAMLQQLLAKAREGDVLMLNRMGADLETSSAEMRPFVNKLHQYTQVYQIEQLCIWLEQQLANAAQHSA